MFRILTAFILINFSFQATHARNLFGKEATMYLKKIDRQLFQATSIVCTENEYKYSRKIYPFSSEPIMDPTEAWIVRKVMQIKIGINEFIDSNIEGLFYDGAATNLALNSGQPKLSLKYNSGLHSEREKIVKRTDFYTDTSNTHINKIVYSSVFTEITDDSTGSYDDLTPKYKTYKVSGTCEFSYTSIDSLIPK